MAQELVFRFCLLCTYFTRCRATYPVRARDVGHGKLEFSNCHETASGTLRQQLWARVEFWLERRQSGAAATWLTTQSGDAFDALANQRKTEP